MVLAIPARFYGLTAVLGTALAVPLVLAVVILKAGTLVTEILVCTYIIALVLSYMTKRKRAYLAAQAKLTRAFGAANQLADESVQTALASTLLSLGHFLHELKNYQTAVGVNLVYLQRTTELDAGGKEALREALAAQVAEQKLVVDTIDALRRRAKPSNSVFMLRELVEHVARDTPGIEVRVDAGEERFLVTGVPDHLRIVLTNLIRNAEQAGATEVLVQLRLEPSGLAVRMIVSDDGPGIPESRRQGLFEPFGGTTKLGGTGLGLYLCRRHVELFGGTIALEPGPLGGASFVIRLPARAVCEAEPAEEGSGPRAKAG
jgi:signal transduction histidine kinase